MERILRSRTTTSSQMTPLEYILTEILDASSSHSPYRSFFDKCGVTQAYEIISLSENDFETTTFFTSSESVNDETVPVATTLNKVQRNKLSKIISWFNHQGDDVSDETWYALTANTLRYWKPSVSKASTTPDTASRTTESLSSKFRKGIKNHPITYAKFHEDRFWTNWDTNIRIMLRVQGAPNVLNSKYVPVTEDEIEVFTDQQTYVFGIFNETVLTTQGRDIIKRHSDALDAQAVYRDLVTVYSHGINAKLSAKLTNYHHDTVKSKTCVSFLTNWRSLVYDLDRIKPDSLSESQKMSWLENAVNSHPELEKFMGDIQLQQHYNRSDTEQTLDDAYSLLLYRAIQIDDKTKQRSVPSNRSANSANSQTSGKPPASSGKKHSDYIPKDKWDAMTSSEKAAIYRTRDSAEPPATTGTDPTAVSTPRPHTAPTYANVAAQAAPPTSVYVATTIPADAPSVTSVPAPVNGQLLRDLMSNASARQQVAASGSALNDTLSVNGATYRRDVNRTNIQYNVSRAHMQYTLSNHDTTHTQGSLIDGGANGGLSGSDVRVMEETLFEANVSGIGDTSLTNLRLATVAGVIETTLGPILGIFHQYAHLGTGKTIHSCTQMRAYGVDVDDLPRPLGGKQRIISGCGNHIIPLSVHGGLTYMPMTCPTDNDVHDLTWVTFTSDCEWNPNIISAPAAMINDPTLQVPEDYQHHDIYRLNDLGRLVESHDVSRVPLPAIELQANFGWVPVERIQQTLNNTSQFARIDTRLPQRKHYRSRFPGLNVKRMNEIVATDTFFSDTPAHDDGILGHGGATMAQLFVGRSSQITAVFPMRKESQFSLTLEDFIRSHGAPHTLMSDNAKTQIGKQSLEILRKYCIDDAQCEPHHQHQNYAERRIQEVKKMVNTIMDRTGTPAKYWYLCLEYAVYLLNRLAVRSLQWKTPYQLANGDVPDISALLQFRWFEPVYYFDPQHASFPSTSSEASGRWVGISINKGDSLTYLILTNDTQQVIVRSTVRSAVTRPTSVNHRASDILTDGEISNESGDTIILSTSDLRSMNPVDSTEFLPSLFISPSFDPEELLGRTFIRDTIDGRSHRARVVKQIEDAEAKNHAALRFEIMVGTDENSFYEIIGYNELTDLIESQATAASKALTNFEVSNFDDTNNTFKFKRIIGHMGPLKPDHKKYKGSSWNVLILWEDNTESYEPLSVIGKDDPITVSAYAEDHNLLSTDGWKQFNRIAKKRKVHEIMIHKLQAKPNRHSPVYKFGVQVPHNAREASQIDAEAGNTKWADAMKLELDQHKEYKTYRDIGPNARCLTSNTK